MGKVLTKKEAQSSGRAQESLRHIHHDSSQEGVWLVRVVVVKM